MLNEINEPYIHPIVRDKAKLPIEFGVKLDLSVDKNVMCRLEKQSINA